ncbi:mucoidy inhibitor MuiA family protein [Methylocystis bryophila]|uniref:DUF4139 domain-containing protein n=1 Tax=Methylocystis bryophila TaxID=655015 RepID=A0A1W6N0D9_9HYPH|nr:mucoidy inhibitor MuiA family protein [Methylocystis bryophila]ARN83334.1 hypothetical protein B1812_03475 [Methylocystis bryophila]BDV40269.1 hypothetical protein DSM21852_35220 [Methylocystis bryophila]
MRRTGWAAFALALSVISGSSALAGETEIVAKSTVVSVLVHPDAATVTREATVSLPSGASTVIFSSVPSALVPDSLRASAEATAALSIGAVEARSKPSAAKAPDSPVVARLKELRAERAALEITIDSLRAKLEMIKTYAKASPEKLGPESKPLAPAEWGAAFDMIGSAYAKTGEALREANHKASELDREIAGLAGAPGAPRGGLARDIAVGVEAASPGEAKIRLTYRTDAAGWRPAYRARLDTGDKARKPVLELEARAVVSQSTGEDWRDAALAVATLRARGGAAPPEVTPQRVRFLEPLPIPAPPPARAMARMGAAAPERPLVGGPEVGTQDEREPKTATTPSAALEASGYAATFKIAGPASAPGDGTAKTFLLSTRRLEPRLSVRAAPALDPQAYLEARIVNADEAPLLPGSVSVERDGAFVGQETLALIPPGDAKNFGFGVDDKVKVLRVPVQRKENEPGWFGQTRTETREFKTTVGNLHDFPVTVTIVDQVPFSENAALVVETLPQTTPPTEKQVDDKRGVAAWSFTLQPGETKELRIAYQLKWPADRELMFER